MERGACLQNALALSSEHPGMRIIVGWAAGAGPVRVDVRHAWVLDAAGVAREITWPEAGQSYLGFDPGE